MSTSKPIMDILTAPLDRSWNIVKLAELLLKSIAEHMGKSNELISVKREDLKDRQSQRLIRPLLAHLAVKAAKVKGVEPNIYEGKYTFQQLVEIDPSVLGAIENPHSHARAIRYNGSTINIAFQFTNKPGNTCASFEEDIPVTIGGKMMTKSEADAWYAENICSKQIIVPNLGSAVLEPESKKEKSR